MSESENFVSTKGVIYGLPQFNGVNIFTGYLNMYIVSYDFPSNIFNYCRVVKTGTIKYGVATIDEPHTRTFSYRIFVNTVQIANPSIAMSNLYRSGYITDLNIPVIAGDIINVMIRVSAGSGYETSLKLYAEIS